MLPALGIPIYNRPDLLRRCLRSIDYPVELLIIVNNGQLDRLGAMVFHEAERNPNLNRAIVYHPGANIGVAGGWNLIMDAAMNSVPSPVQKTLNGTFPLGVQSGVLICGNDIEWQAGQLREFIRVWSDNPDADFLFAYWSFSTFMATRAGFARNGYFDENIWPAYLEDSDYFRRIGLNAAKMADVPVKPIHGEAPHWGSTTVKSDSALEKRNVATHDRNWNYYIRKWGGRREGHSEVNLRPFADWNIPVNQWRLEPHRRLEPHYKDHAD